MNTIFGKPDFIKKIEEESGILSIMNYKTLPQSDFRLIDSKLDTVWSVSSFLGDNNIFWNEKIYKTKQNFYIRVEAIKTFDLRDMWVLSIYYKQEQFNELLLFIKSLTKELENARIDNTRA